MTTLAEIETAVISLSKTDFTRFREWFDALRNHRWDQEFEADAAGGLLDSLADEALADFNAGKCKEL
ncbi:MAG: hypothetical protein ACTFAK_16845 [Candidatus Electronema sp. VV]